jgi:NAD(P)-dependent dehydrogenase (short-subunit alcohol dehydrogenase family)
VARDAGSIDISFNLITHGDVQGTPLVEMTPEDFGRPVETAVRTMFLTSRAAARHMIKQGSGVILVFGGEGDPPRGYNLGGLQVAFHAMEALRRQLSMELGQYGIRVVTWRTGGIPESITGELRRARCDLSGASSSRRCSTVRPRSRTLAMWPPSSRLIKLVA